ncbi:Na(+)/H(+) antiporter subunit B [Pseudoruegeria aquimaris]|uniref:Na(+)/H(+) antiporter subunit B n=1 Tax=Pseudoruegeria aquimaris TaxID=393663 RepID=A0A1Y5RA71_9RHOB|nr:Na+/H+ antiporter subunit B [Pseudoruegeria aquimaris]SLN12367.1 Na(+)/H(+) antiporter subunit B [Pseudoruegeria aquimaris]
MNSLILRVASRYLAAILLVFSIYMLFRGHNEPGGGFIGGLIGATGFILYAVACGTREARATLRVDPQSLAMSGLAASLLSAFASALFRDAPFTGQWLFLGATEGSKGIPVSTVILFDIGVYLVVLGAILMLVFAMEEEI